MTKVQNAWEDMRICYQIRYAKLCKRGRTSSMGSSDQGASLEMSYVLQEIFGLTDKQVREVEINGGLTDEDIEKE